MKILLIALLILPLSACLEKKERANSIYQLLIQSANNKAHVFDIEIAINKPDQVKGLMFRTEMAEDAGMLFYFGEETERAFWMKNTLIPLDIIFIKANGTIHHIHERAIPEDLTRIPSYGPVAAVLEINGGMAEKLNIQKGDIIKHSVFGNN